MNNATLAIVLLAALAVIATIAASVAVFQARTARAALRAHDAAQRERVGPPRATDTGARASAGEPAAAPPDAAPPDAFQAPGDRMTERGSGPPVLVVEDEPGVRELIRRILVRGGHQVITVAGPHEALSALKRQPSIALMIADVVMPEMDGYDLAAEARALSPGIAVVFMSAFARDATRHPAGDSFLAKPFTAESLMGAVTATLGRPRGLTPSTSPA